MKKLVGIIVVCALFVFYIVYGFNSSARYTVVLDPGHGGLSLEPISIHGDKYDHDQAKYLAAYQEGASCGNIFEGEMAYEIALAAKEILDLTRTSSGRVEFQKILLRYSPSADVPREPINVILSREKGYSHDKYNTFNNTKDEDYNAPFRLFDFPDLKTSHRKPGLVSRMNSESPDLVVSLHLDSIGPTNGAMAPVVTPGYSTFQIARDYIMADSKTRREIKRDFQKSPYLNWVQMSGSRSAFEWFLCDAWIYFTGYWSTKNGLNPDPDSYKGLRQDMISWAYSRKSWEDQNNPDKMAGLPDLKNLNLGDPFWQREVSEPENWKREGGMEGVGGDNLYSANEIMRFIRLGLFAHDALPEKKLPDIREPHWSTWSVPTYINAINAFIELGFLNNRYDRDRLLKYRDIHAEAIAVGIYSLLYGLKISPHNINDMPTGTPLNLERYKNYQGSDYFKSVMRRP